MVFAKVVRAKSYYQRFQTKFRRRREGRTDYRARSRLVGQDNTKYNTPKYRLVARFSNRNVTAQVIRTKIDHDEVVAHAYSWELKKYGISAGLTNYAAAYATGLLLARRLLTKFNQADRFEGNTDVGEYYDSRETWEEEDGEGARPFGVILDVGLRRTSRGSKVFAVLKGAADGGLHVPHDPKRFVGYDEEEDELDSEKLQKNILGGHVADYMEHLKSSDPEKYERHFSVYIAAGLTADKIKDAYTAAHEKIRADPSFKATTKKNRYPTVKGRKAKITLGARRNRVKQRLAAFRRRLAFEAANA